MRNILTLCGTAALAGCVSQINYVHKTGSTDAERQAALDECRVQAIQQVPAQSRVVVIPGVHTPGTTYCNTIGSSTTCNTVGGINVPDSVETVDDNAGLRNRMIGQCLANRGFDVVPMKLCTGGKKDYTGDVQPPLSNIPCATRRLQM